MKPIVLTNGDYITMIRELDEGSFLVRETCGDPNYRKESVVDTLAQAMLTVVHAWCAETDGPGAYAELTRTLHIEPS